MSGLILPGLTLALVYMAGYVRMTRAFVLESMTEDYIRTAHAKGLAPRRVLFKHTHARGPDAPGHDGRPRPRRPDGWRDHHRDACSTTRVSASWPTRPPRQYDLPLIVGIVLLLATFVILANIIVDLPVRRHRPARPTRPDRP